MLAGHLQTMFSRPWLRHPSRAQWIAFCDLQSPAGERPRLAAHLHRCAACRDQVGKLRAGLEALEEKAGEEEPAEARGGQAPALPLLRSLCDAAGSAAELMAELSPYLGVQAQALAGPDMTGPRDQLHLLGRMDAVLLNLMGRRASRRIVNRLGRPAADG